MQSTGWARRIRYSLTVGGVLLLVGCGTAGVPSGTSPTGTASNTASPNTASPNTASPNTASPNASLSTTPVPSDSPSSLDSTSGTPSVGGSASAADPSGSVTPGGGTPGAGGCTTLTPVRVEQVVSQPRRTTEVVSMVSDGKSFTPGTREQTEFLPATLRSPDATEVSDPAVITKVASLIAAAGKNRVLLTRPDTPGTVGVFRPPFTPPGTYVFYNASAPLTAEVIVSCDGQDQRWSFSGEADNSIGQVNCAVEPSKTNAIARLVYTNNC